MFFDFAERFGAPTEKIAPIYKKYLSDGTFCDDLWQKLFCGYEKGYGLPLYREAFVPSQFFSTANACCTRENLDRDLFFLALYNIFSLTVRHKLILSSTLPMLQLKKFSF